MPGEIMRERSRRQQLTMAGLPLVIIGGWWYPLLGLFLLACMVGAVALAFRRGRQWCDWMCPRGSFFDQVLGRLGKRRPLPAFTRKAAFRAAVLSSLLLGLGVQVVAAWPDPMAIGFAMVRVLTVTTTLGIVLGSLFEARAWCHLCPMGSIAASLAKGKQPLAIADGCRSCKVCEKACPMQLAPYEAEDGFMTNRDCIKCGSCIAACPKKILSFPAREERRAA